MLLHVEGGEAGIEISNINRIFMCERTYHSGVNFMSGLDTELDSTVAARRDCSHATRRFVKDAVPASGPAGDHVFCLRVGAAGGRPRITDLHHWPMDGRRRCKRSERLRHPAPAHTDTTTHLPSLYGAAPDPGQLPGAWAHAGSQGLHASIGMVGMRHVPYT